MKKSIFYFILVAILVCNAMSPIVYGQGNSDSAKPEKIDSLAIEEAVKQQLSAAEDTIILRTYVLNLCGAFLSASNMDQALSRHECQVVYTVLDADGDFQAYRYQNDTLTEYNGGEISSACMRQFFDDSIILSISDQIIVENKYHIAGGMSRSGAAVYYETNMGDYIYYWGPRGTDLLLSVKVYRQLQKKSFDISYDAAMNGKYGSDVDIWDLTPYQWQSPNFDPHAALTVKNDGTYDFNIVPILIVCICMITCVAGGLLWYRKRKMAPSNPAT